MMKIKGFYRLLSDLSGGKWGIAIISAVLPIVITMGFGFVLAFQHGHILILSLSIAVSSLLVTLPLYVVNRASQRKNKGLSDSKEDLDDSLVKVSDDWSQQELAIWQATKSYSRQRLQAEPQWRDLDVLGLDVLAFVAEKFDKKTLDFSIPEALKLFEEVSRRYKMVIKENIPAIEYLKVSYIKAGYEAYEQYGETGQRIIHGAIWANHVKNLYFNPLKVVSDLAKQQATSAMTKGFADDMQSKAKEALLDEVTAVAIDLYSGRFSFEEGDIQCSQVTKRDAQRLAPDLEPIRVVLVGQTGSGKSSIINVLQEHNIAEVDPLPSTDNSTVYQTNLNEHEVRIVDTKGLDGSEKTSAQMLKEMTEADLILWVTKANQSARELDKRLCAQFEDFYLAQENISRKKPIIFAAVNQVDKLSPTSEWSPPYDIENPVGEKAAIIAQAVTYNQQLLNTDLAFPLSVAKNKPSFGVDTLKQVLIDGVEQASHVQRNRQRIETIVRGVSLRNQANRVVTTGKKLAPKVARKVTPSRMVAFFNNKKK
ncbi:GTP-binding protein [Vibrio sp. 10N.286.49.B3]|uniref:GTPase n=1 Tax=Vibrio sp. 10N.286.49.B3 TaxID=1880855 RepID=UPI000C845A7D|nr:GTPase [Vibrio sp. 10N.286.49.B3]PMH44616.1 GTP-binding protein [Vibrio sp. 10N.286.49.B3]